MIHIDSNLLERIAAIPLRNGRRIVAIAGAPASGKSTLAADLVPLLSKACVLPMDGFHRSNADLERAGLLSRKGAPQTFDTLGFSALLRAVRNTKEVAYPTFDRTRDCVVPEGGHIGAADQTILVEGNYLLLDQKPWNDLAQHWDFSVWLDVDIDTLRARLVQRWLDNGHDAAAALARAEHNDLPNARLIETHRLPASFTISR